MFRPQSKPIRDDRFVIVTGASRGFGCLIAARLAANGWRVFATMRDPSSRAALDGALVAAGADARNVRVVQLDVLDPQSIDAAIADVLRQSGGRLHAVVPNAGVAVVGAFEDTPASALRRTIDTNFIGVAETVRAALPALRATRGRIVLISSDSGLYGTPGLSAYSASKHALEGWAESLAYELAPLGVRLSIIEPGAFKTDIWTADVHRSPAGPYAAFGEATERAWLETGKKAPAPDPVARAVVAALNARRPKLRYVVGQDAKRMSALKRMLPARLFQAVVKRSSGLGS